MNLPNKLTTLRVLLIPFFVFFIFYDKINYNNYYALFIFVIAALTDALDGYIARKYKAITNFGKFMDPLADKLLVSSALICFVSLATIPAYIVIIIISREFIISGFRLIASDNGIVIAASYFGKLKTVAQIIMSILLIINSKQYAFKVLADIFIYLSLALTIISLVDYIIKNKSVIFNGDI